MQQLQLSSIPSRDRRLTVPGSQRCFEFDVVSATLKGLMSKAWMERPFPSLPTARSEVYLRNTGAYELSFRGVPPEGFGPAHEQQGPAPHSGCDCASYEMDMYGITESTRPKDMVLDTVGALSQLDMETRMASKLAMMHSGEADVDVDTSTMTVPPPSDLTEALQDSVARCLLLSPELRGCHARGHGFHVAIVAKVRAGARPAGATDGELVRAVQAAFPDLDLFRRYMGSDESLWKKTFQFSITLLPGGLDDAAGRPIEIGLPPDVHSRRRRALRFAVEWASRRSLGANFVVPFANEYVRTQARKRIGAALQESATTRLGLDTIDRASRVGAGTAGAAR